MVKKNSMVKNKGTAYLRLRLRNCFHLWISRILTLIMTIHNCKKFQLRNAFPCQKRPKLILKEMLLSVLAAQCNHKLMEIYKIGLSGSIHLILMKIMKSLKMNTDYWDHKTKAAIKQNHLMKAINKLQESSRLLSVYKKIIRT